METTNAGREAGQVVAVTAICMPAYQVMPPLSSEEYEALRTDIAARGVLVPVVRDQHGNLLDGHHRQQIAAELGIDCPVEVRHVADGDQARDVAFALNLARRHLSREQRRDLIRREIGLRPDDSDRGIARRLSCDHKTVGSVRRELSGEIPQQQLTTAQSGQATALFISMRGRTLEACRRIKAGEPVMAWIVMDELGATLAREVIREAWGRYVEWANTSEDTYGVLWRYADEDEDEAAAS
jgi:hypothetical protein